MELIPHSDKFKSAHFHFEADSFRHLEIVGNTNHLSCPLHVWRGKISITIIFVNNNNFDKSNCSSTCRHLSLFYNLIKRVSFLAISDTCNLLDQIFGRRYFFKKKKKRDNKPSQGKKPTNQTTSQRVIREALCIFISIAFTYEALHVLNRDNSSLSISNIILSIFQFDHEKQSIFY